MFLTVVLFINYSRSDWRLAKLIMRRRPDICHLPFATCNLQPNCSHNGMGKATFLTVVLFVCDIMNRNFVYAYNNLMIKKDLIINRLIGLFSWLLVCCFLFITATDVYIKNYGDISERLPTADFIREVEAVGYIYRRDEGYIRLMTYNLLSDSLGFSGTDAGGRAGGVCVILDESEPDVICFQEMSRKWFATVKSNTQYKFINFFRTAVLGTMTTIAYNSKTLELLFSGEQTFSVGGDSRLRRMVWGVFSDKKNGKIFAVVNVHFDLSKRSESGISDDSIQLSQALETVGLVKEVIEKLKCPIFILGDFNAKEGTTARNSPVYELLEAAFYNAEHQAKCVSEGSAPRSATYKNDHIFYYGNVSVERYCLLSNEAFSTLSDHYPIFVDVRLASEE